MFKVSLVLVLALLCNGCASSASNDAVAPKVTKVSNPPKLDRLVRYASMQGCKMVKNGYMVCPKSMNR